MHLNSHRGRTACCSHQMQQAIRYRSHRTTAGLQAPFLKLQASFSSAEYFAEAYRSARFPPLLQFQRSMMADRIEREQVQKQVQISAAAEALIVQGRMAAELLAVRKQGLAEALGVDCMTAELLAERREEQAIAALAAELAIELITVEIIVSDHKVNIDSATAAW